MEHDLHTMQQVYLANRNTPRATQDLAKVIAYQEYMEHDLAKQVESDLMWRRNDERGTGVEHE